MRTKCAHSDRTYHSRDFNFRVPSNTVESEWGALKCGLASMSIGQLSNETKSKLEKKKNEISTLCRVEDQVESTSAFCFSRRTTAIFLRSPMVVIEVSIINAHLQGIQGNYKYFLKDKSK